jgi:uncharacterized RDD family membrane protein YckC
LAIDWASGNLIAFGSAGPDIWDARNGQVWLPLLCWYGLVVLTTGFAAGSPGQIMLRLRVVRLDGWPMSLGIAALRTLLVALVLPPLVFTKDGRGLHDLMVKTAVINVGHLA